MSHKIKSSKNYTWFQFSYTWIDGMSVIGLVNGNLQEDKNTVLNLSNVFAFVKNCDGVFISEFFDVPILSANNHLTLDGSSLEFGFASNKGDAVKFFGNASSFLFITSLILDRVRVISFEEINSNNWIMFKYL